MEIVYEVASRRAGNSWRDGASGHPFFVASAVGEFRGSRVNKAKPKEVLFVLNEAAFPYNRISRCWLAMNRRSFTGDHLDYYCISLAKFDPSDFAKKEWHEGPEAGRRCSTS